MSRFTFYFTRRRDKGARCCCSDTLKTAWLIGNELVLTNEIERNYSMPDSISTAMGDRLRAGKPPRFAASHSGQLSLLPPAGRKMSTGRSVVWQVRPCDPSLTCAMSERFRGVFFVIKRYTVKNLRTRKNYVQWVKTHGWHQREHPATQNFFTKGQPTNRAITGMFCTWSIEQMPCTLKWHRVILFLPFQPFLNSTSQWQPNPWFPARWQVYPMHRSIRGTGNNNQLWLHAHQSSNIK